MEEFNKGFEDEWKKAFEDAEEEPSAQLWQSLENKLAEKELLNYKKKYFYWKVAASVLLILFSATSFYLVYHHTYQDSFAHSAERTSGQVDKHDIIIINKNFPNDNTHALEEKEFSKAAPRNKSNKTSTVDKMKSTAVGTPNVTKERKETNSSDVVFEARSLTLAKSNYGSKSIISSKALAKEEILGVKESSYDLVGHANGFASSNLDSKASSITNKKDSKPNQNQNYLYLSQLNELAPKDPLLQSGEFVKTQVKYRPTSLDLSDVKYASSKKNKRSRGWYAGYDFTPTITNQNFQASAAKTPVTRNLDGALFSRQAQLDEVNRTESAKELEQAITPVFSYNSGIRGGYQFNKRLKIETGINYAYTQSKVETNYYAEDRYSSSQNPAFNVFFDDNVNSDVTIGAVKTPEKISAGAAAAPPMYGGNNTSKDVYRTVKMYTQYVGVPVTLNYKLIDRKVNVFIGGGVSADFFLQYGTKEDEKQGFEKESLKSSESSSFKPVGFSLLISPEVEYNFSSRYSFYLRPVYKGALNSYTDTKKISHRPNSSGIGFGLRYNLR